MVMEGSTPAGKMAPEAPILMGVEMVRITEGRASVYLSFAPRIRLKVQRQQRTGLCVEGGKGKGTYRMDEDIAGEAGVGEYKDRERCSRLLFLKRTGRSTTNRNKGDHHCHLFSYLPFSDPPIYAKKQWSGGAIFQ